MADKLIELLTKLRDGTITSAEKSMLDSWYLDEAKVKSSRELPEDLLQEDLERLRRFNPAPSITSIFKKTHYWSAAAVLLMLFFGIFYYFKLSTANEIIAVGGNKAQLVLSNGDIVDLESLEENKTLEKGNVVIYKTDNGTITYTMTGKGTSVDAVDIIKTPKGGEFKIVLVDGTKVWLNANSSLKFFTTLEKDTRNVWLEGEAYFEVSHNKSKPFFVHSSQQDIQVLGTKFNVRSVGEESQTTLVEGKVALQNGRLVLKPGQQLVTLKGKDLPVRNVDVDSYLAWKDGDFLFNNEPLSDVMEKISTWYDVEIVYSAHIKEELIWANISKYRDINEVLNMIEKTGVAKFKLEGRKVIVSQ